MANYIATTEELTAVADAIRAKGGTSDALAFPDGFVSAIGSIQTGGGSSGGSFFAPSTASGRLPEVARGAANTTFALDFTSSATGALQEG